MRKKIIAFLCTTSLLTGMFSLMPAAASSTVSTNIPKTFTVVKQDPAATVVSFWHAMSGSNAVAVDNIVNWYNSTEGKKNKIYVKSIYQGDYASISVKVNAVIQAGNLKELPDVLQCGPDSVYSLLSSKYLIYMEDIMNADKTFTYKNKMNKNCMYACSYKGKQLGMPFSNSVCVLHYNVSAFKAAGLDPDDPPKTFTELASYAQKLVIKGTGSKPKRYGWSLKLGEWQLSTLIPRQKKGSAYQFNNEDGRQGTPTKLACAQDGTLKALLTEYKKLTDTGAADYKDSSPVNNFKTGVTAMYFGTSINYNSIEDYFGTMSSKEKENKAFVHKMSAMPVVNSDDAIGSGIGGSALYMLSKNDAKKKSAAWNFIKFMCSSDVSAYWFVQSGYFPMNNDALKTKYVQDVMNKNANQKVLLKILTDSEKYYKFQEPYIPNLNTYKSMLADQIAIMASGKQTVDQTVKNVSKKAQAVLDSYSKANK